MTIRSVPILAALALAFGCFIRRGATPRRRYHTYSFSGVVSDGGRCNYKYCLRDQNLHIGIL